MALNIDEYGNGRIRLPIFSNESTNITRVYNLYKSKYVVSVYKKYCLSYRPRCRLLVTVPRKSTVPVLHFVRFGKLLDEQLIVFSAYYYRHEQVLKVI